MALKTAVTVALADVDETPEVPPEIPRHAGDGRPKIRNLIDPTRASFYARASSYGEVIEDRYLIHRRELRGVVYGMGRREDLLLSAQAVRAFTEPDDKALAAEYRTELQRIASDAMSAAGLDLAAARGTALHKLSERKDRGDDLSFLGPKAYAALDQWRRLLGGFEILGTEQFVVCDELGAAGTYDRLLSPLAPLPVIVPVDGAMTQVAVIEPGDTVVADLKSGSSTKHFGPTYAVQQWIYASGSPYAHVSDEDAANGENGRGAWPGSRAPRLDWALIPHVPLDHPEDAGLLWVNLARGRQLAELSRDIRAARKFGDLFFEAPVPLAPAVMDPVRDVRVALLDMIATISTESAFAELYAIHADVWSDDLTAAVRARMAQL